MMRTGLAALLLWFASGVPVQGATQPSVAASMFDRAAWIADFGAIRDALTRAYPNLEWAVERGMDLAAA